MCTIKKYGMVTNEWAPHERSPEKSTMQSPALSHPLLTLNTHLTRSCHYTEYIGNMYCQELVGGDSLGRNYYKTLNPICPYITPIILFKG